MRQPSEPASRPSCSGPACATLCAVLALSFMLMGCERVSTMFSRAPLPDMGPPIPAVVHMQFDPSLTSAMANYANACNQPEELKIGAELESVLLEAAHQTFRAVQLPGATSTEGPADIEVFMRLEQSGLRIQTDGVYDRLPAELNLEAIAIFKDRSGKVIAERPLKATRRERIIVEPTQRRCAYVSMDSFLHDAAVGLSTQFMREARSLLDPGSQTAAANPSASSAMPPSTPQTAVLSFKATLLDENGNLVLEPSERVRVRVDVANAGAASASGVMVSVKGPPVILAQFPSSSLPVGILQAGETRSVEFTGTMPPSLQAQGVDLVVTVTETSGATGPSAQTIAATIEPGAGMAVRAKILPGSFDQVDHIPAAAAGFQQPHTYVVSVGISTHRDANISARKYAAMDAELVAAHFRSLGGVPASNVRVLQDSKALRPDIEEVILDWLPAQVTPESVVIVYFAGNAKVLSSGEIFLMPYEGGTSTSRLYPLKDLQASLGRLKARQVLFIFDGSVSRLTEATAPAKNKEPQWDSGGTGIVRLIGTAGLRNGLEPDTLRHSLFTYYLLRGLRGEADNNLDREVTMGELAAFLGRAVPSAAKQAFSQEQRPLIIPPIHSGSKPASVTLTRASGSDGR